MATEPWPAYTVRPPPYVVWISRTPAPKRSRGSPRPGISTFPSTTTGDPSAGQMLTNAPPSGLTTPGSVTVATSMAAIAASTAEPPAWMRSIPAWAARGLVAATAARLFTRRLSATGAAGAR